MDEDKLPENLDPNEITIEEINLGNQTDELESYTRLLRMLRTYLDLLGLELIAESISPGAETGDYLLKLRISVNPEALMTPEQKEFESKFKEIVENYR